MSAEQSDALGMRPVSSPFKARKTLIFANDKSSGKTTSCNAVLVSLLQRYPTLMRTVDVREYERQPRLSLIFRKEDGFNSIMHRDARNAAAFDMARALAYDPNATAWDDLLYDIGVGNLIVDLGSNTFSEICRILDDEPRPIFPDGGDRVAVAVPITTAADSIESGMAAIDHVCSWGPRTHVFIIEQEYLGRFTPELADWCNYRDRLLAADPSRVTLVRIEKLAVADIGSVVFQRIDKIVENAQAMLRSDKLTGASLLRALRQARAEISWGNRTLESVRPIADWFAN
ncbi:MAG: hypothetical protein P4L66_13980 [Acetobacteraceae bacterium]|nr:hypothetical protein [Acetobacteraceae bacterium]